MQVKERQRRFKLPEMEGAMACWYAQNRGSASQLATYRAQAAQLTADLPNGARVLEVAPGPGYLAIEIARLGRFHVTALDISHTFVGIASGHARQAGVEVDFRQGDVAAMPFEAGSFDLVVCQAAFKNFTRPVAALDEMHRVLRPGGTAVIQDMRSDASGAEIAEEVRGMGAGRLNALLTRAALTGLKRRAYSPARFANLVAESAFDRCDIRPDGIGMEVRLPRPRAGA